MIGTKTLRLALIVACAMLALIGCRKTTPMQNFVSPMPTLESASDKDVEAAIRRAGLITSWQIVPTGERTLTGTLNVRSHQATVTIKYNKTEYSIAYLNSANLKHGEGKIHPNYNKWVKTLNDNIRNELHLLTIK